MPPVRHDAEFLLRPADRLDSRRVLDRRTINGAIWLAAFCFAAGIFLGATQLLRGIPPTPNVAVGRVTIEHASKLRDYATALLFFILVPAATLWLQQLGVRQEEIFRRRSAHPDLASALFIAPFFLAPFLYLTTFKWGWPLLIPLAASQLGPRALIGYERTHWIRRLLARAMAPANGLIVFEALSWILFRYVAVGRRIAHVPTLFLEIVFVAFFIAAFWAAFALIARLATLAKDVTMEVALQRVAVGAMPILVLPLMALSFLPGAKAISIVMPLVVVTILFALRGNAPIDPHALRRITAYAAVPFLLYCVSYASTAALTQWIDLFHRGEALGPASDYLRGKIPYRDVFVLHGLLEDGQLDAWLMRLFGRNVDIALARPVVLGSLAVPALWYVAMAIFDSIPIAAVTMLLGAVTTVDNEREFFEIAVLALLLAAMRRQSKTLYALSGVVAGVTLFFSFDIGLYSIGGALLTIAVLRRRSLLPFIAGVVIGCAPFAIYLGSRGALGAFFETSFVVLPRIIDAIWSLPFPDLTTTFRKDLNLRALSDFVLTEQFRYILNPLVIGIAIAVLAQRAIRRRATQLDAALFALTAFAILTQRSALGRADFPHQYFSAFLIGPMIVALLVMARRTVVLLLVPILIVALWVPDLVNLRLDDTTHYLGRVSRIGWVDPAAVEIGNRIDAVRFWVTQESKPNQPIFDFSNQPAFYFFCNRANPTRFYQVPILSPREFQRETIVALERSKPPLVIRRSPQEFDVFDGVDNAVRAQAVAAYLDDHYTFAHTTRGVEIWSRKPASPPLNLDGYLRRIRTPSLKELGTLGTRARIVFPSVGSVPGVGGAYWRSDLLLHNPYKQPLVLDLRYVSNDVRTNRSVSLAAGQSFVWNDVVRSFFGAPEGRGALWIEYHGTTPPVARVKTADIAHDAKASIDAPLTLGDAATAGSPNDDLTILGLPSTAGRRINIGIVNVGAIPATFRITARSRTGQPIGAPIEEGLPEDQSYTASDLETLLKTKLDETTSVHVRAVAGTLVAYATVVDAGGNTQFIAALPTQQP